jgi:hypothetical protein
MSLHSSVRVDNTRFSPYRYGAVGDGVTDDLAACQAAVDAAQTATLGKVVELGRHHLSGDIVVTAGKVKIRGGYLTGGGISVTPSSVGDLDFEISGVTIDRGTITSNAHGITLSKCGRGTITNCTILHADHAFHVAQVASTFQHVRRVKFSNNVVDNCNYALWMYGDDTLVGGLIYGVGDIHWTNNQSSTIQYSHIYGRGVDGLVCTGNTMFSRAASDVTKMRHVDIDYLDWGLISNNNLFEAGHESIRLAHFQDCNISGNNIAWPGQTEMCSGILLEQGDVSGTAFNISAVTGNNIQTPTKHGIEIAAACGRMSVTGNQIRSAGSSAFYRGSTDLGSITHYGLSTGACVFLSLIGNQSSANQQNITSTGWAYGNLDSVGGGGPSTSPSLTLSAAETSISSGQDVERVNCNQPSSATVTSITTGWAGQTLTLLGLTGNTTLQHNAGIVLKSAADATIPTNGVLTLRFMNSKWYETSRSF